MAIESKNLLVAVKAYARANALPLDSSEIYESLDAAQTYAAQANAYEGQTIKVLVNGAYQTYVLDPKADGADAYTLTKVGLDTSEVTNYVQVVTALPATGQEQGVIYVNTTDNKGYIYNGTAYQVIFEEIDGLADTVAAVETLSADVATLQSGVAVATDESGAVTSVTITAPVTVTADPTEDLGVATKQYVDRLVDGLNSFTVGVVDSTNALPTTGYTVGQTFRVAEAGTYAGTAAEAGDLILVIQDYAEGTASDSDFMVIQANIDGAVTGPDASTDANIAVFDGITGKKIKDSSVTLASLQDAIAKAHEHSNLAILETYTSTQTELLATAQGYVDTAKAEIDTALAGKVDTTTLDSYYTKTDVDSQLTTITDNLNTKVDSAAVSEAIAAKVGDIAEGTTVKAYIDTAVGSGGTASAEAIATAKAEAIAEAKTYADTQDATTLASAQSYTDTAIENATLVITEF